MSDLDKLLAEEAEHAEQHKDAEPGPDTKISQPNLTRSQVFSVRLNNDEMQRLAAVAAQAGIAPSTMARSIILKQLAGGPLPESRQFQEAFEAARSAMQPMFEQLQRTLRQLIPMQEMIVAAGLTDPKVRERMRAIAEEAARSR